MRERSAAHPVAEAVFAYAEVLRASLGAVPVEPAAPAPQRWLEFLDDLWSDDEQAKTTLAEIVGYLVAGDTREQKIFGLIGPRRSGKGTIALRRTGLVGRHNVAGPTISGLATNFGLQELIGKPAGIVSTPICAPIKRSSPNGSSHFGRRHAHHRPEIPRSWTGKLRPGS